MVKVGLIESKGNVYLRAYRKDLELISKAKVACLSNGCDIIERFELSLTAEVKLKLWKTREIIDLRKGELLALHLGLLADVVTFRVPPR